MRVVSEETSRQQHYKGGVEGDRRKQKSGKVDSPMLIERLSCNCNHHTKCRLPHLLLHGSCRLLESQREPVFVVFLTITSDDCAICLHSLQRPYLHLRIVMSSCYLDLNTLKRSVILSRSFCVCSPCLPPRLQYCQQQPAVRRVVDMRVNAAQ